MTKTVTEGRGWRGRQGRKGVWGMHGDLWVRLARWLLPGQLICPALALGSPSCTPLVLIGRLTQCGLVGRDKLKA